MKCKQCGKREVEPERECYATPVCFTCLPPPKPLPVAAWPSSRAAIRLGMLREVRERALSLGMASMEREVNRMIAEEEAKSHGA